MKWVRFEKGGRAQYGLLNGNTITATSLELRDVLAGKKADKTGEYAVKDVRLLSPIARPGKIACIGQNYWDHCREQGKEPPSKPIIFSKFASCIIATGDYISWSPEVTQMVDFEAELAVIIGKTASRVKEADALNYVFGYTTANDVTARDLQKGDGQWVRGKSLDTFLPLGPVMVTADEIPNPQNLKIRTELNGQVMQNSNTSEMIFNVAHLIHYCSQAFTLEPGDILMTGTPDGVGMYRNPQVFMQKGDRIMVEIEGIGRLENICTTF